MPALRGQCHALTSAEEAVPIGSTQDHSNVQGRSEER
jgi:hypothetical protein